MSVTVAQTVPGYTAAAWTIDPVHSEIGFSVHTVSNVRGKVEVSGARLTGQSPLDSSVTATIDRSSIDTGNKDRDNHLRSTDSSSSTRTKR
jgi:polyisoprenoid-binding protein YceI